MPPALLAGLASSLGDRSHCLPDAEATLRPEVPEGGQDRGSRADGLEQRAGFLHVGPGEAPKGDGAARRQVPRLTIRRARIPERAAARARGSRFPGRSAAGSVFPAGLGLHGLRTRAGSAPLCTHLGALSAASSWPISSRAP